MGFNMIVTLFAGLGLFLYGMHIMSDALQKLAGDRLKRGGGRMGGLGTSPRRRGGRAPGPAER